MFSRGVVLRGERNREAVAASVPTSGSSPLDRSQDAVSAVACTMVSQPELPM